MIAKSLIEYKEIIVEEIVKEIDAIKTLTEEKELSQKINRMYELTKALKEAICQNITQE